MTINDEDGMQEALREVFDSAIGAGTFGHDEMEVPEALVSVRLVQTFEAAGVLTTDRGLVVSMEDGREFQITVVRSR